MPDPRDLCTLTDVRALMQKTAADVAQDALIATLITRASVKIMRDYGREFVPGGPDGIDATAATRTFEYAWGDQYPGEAFVDLRPYDLQTLTGVSVDTDQSSPIVLSSDEYRLWPQPPTGGVYMALKVSPLNVSVGLVGWRKRQITVTGDWGFPAIPLEVTQACAETVIYWITANPATHRFAGSPDGAPAPVSPRGYPMAALDLLSGFKRMTV